MNQFLKRTLQGDRVVWVVFGLLCIISILEMFSASSSLVWRFHSIQAPILRHVMFLVVGFFFMLFVQLIDFKYIRFWGYIFFALSIVLLIYTLAYGTEQQGATRFIRVVGIQFQPSELAKLTLLIVLSDQIARCQNPQYQAKAFWIIMLVILGVCGLIFVENFSTAAILFSISFIMMWIGGIDWKKLFFCGAVIIFAVAMMLFIAWVWPDNNISFLHRADTWIARIENHFELEENKFYINENNAQEVHAKIAIAKGGFLLSGPGTSVERNYLPEAFSDFIFAIIVEEGGFFAGVFVILLYLVLLFRAGVVAHNSESVFCSVLVIGVTFLIVIQALIHVAVSVNVIPVTGQPLPLISRGGTSILVNSIYFGIIISVTRSIQNRKREEAGMAPQPIIASENEEIEIEKETEEDAHGIEIIKE